VLGSVYFTGDILAATDQLELLCRQSKTRSHGMKQYQQKDHFVRKTLSCSWCNGYVIRPVVGLGLEWPEARLIRGPLMTSSYSANRDKHF